ncbi:MAG TPA: carboxypeptidase regulatory-like domain-containing protein [Candidatus Eremiobacteraceae bacterium]|nr:carboxypeptidase regulatory-like domain-containing protein [Candidatus Eremiobacteraceae bacterium]
MKLFRLGVVVAFLLSLAYASVAAGQSLTLGSIAGRVTDPTGAVIAGANVSLKSLDTGEVQATATSAEGSYRFNLLKPGKYEVTVNVTGFAKTVQTTSVAVGQTSQVDVALELSKAAETIEVSGSAPLISTEPGIATSYTPEEVALLPAAGGDITTLAFTSPGVVVAPGTGYGNFTVNGLSGTSNLYTVNGENDMDPYFNINNSGATNLTLGSNEMQETTIVTNPYSGEYGQLSGAQVNYVTKSGTNSFHGNAQYWWNGRAMNSNDFISNASGAPRPFSNANQWAASIGGPIVKDHLWFFVDTEGLRFILPNVDTETIPTTAFASAVLTNLGTTNPSELPMYQNMFNIYAAAASGKQVSPIAPAGTECAGVTLPGFAAGSPCQELVTLTPAAFAKEWILAPRIDLKVTSKDDLFFRFKIDHGLQPTYIDPLSSAFDANSNQPAYDYQVNERHVFGPNVTNSFTATLSHYVAQFVQDIPAWQKEFPYGAVTFGGAVGFSPINPGVGSFPQGRNVTQYQFIDDFSWVKGKHTFKFGENFRRYDVSDHNFFNIYPTSNFNDLSSTTLGPTGLIGMQAFADGLAYSFTQGYSPRTDVPIGLWGIGFYAEDGWKVKSNFTLTLALRFEKNANPTCNVNCFSNYNAPFNDLTSVQAGPAGAGDIPYSSDIHAGQRHPYFSVDPINVSPRVSFSWSPNASNHFPWFQGGNKTVISGGVGIFYDNPPAGMLDEELGLPGNPPATTLFTIAPLDSSGGTIGIAPFTAGPSAFAAASSAFTLSKSYNQLSAILDPIIGFNPPVSFNSIQGTIHSPQVQEWNLKVDQEVSKSVALSVNYVGNHAINIPYYNSWWNAVATNSVFASVPGIKTTSTVLPNYGEVTTLQSGAVSNYNGITGSVRLQYHSWLMSHFNYTFSHTLDETSNGGLFPIGGWGNGYNVQTQINPGSLKANNYGNADYDIRHLFNADYVITPAVHFGNGFVKAALGGWQWSGKVFLRSALPYTVLDAYSFGDIAYTNALGIVGNVISGGANPSCGVGAVVTNKTIHPCTVASAFTNTTATGFAYTSYPNQARNQFRGPGYVDFDMGLFKTFSLKERFKFGAGATAFNVFNHPNFNLPDSLLGSPTFGEILSPMQGVPTSPYGNFLHFDSSVRVVQLSLKVNF